MLTSFKNILHTSGVLLPFYAILQLISFLFLAGCGSGATGTTASASIAGPVGPIGPTGASAGNCDSVVVLITGNTYYTNLLGTGATGTSGQLSLSVFDVPSSTNTGAVQLTIQDVQQALNGMTITAIDISKGGSIAANNELVYTVQAKDITVASGTGSNLALSVTLNATSPKATVLGQYPTFTFPSQNDQLYLQIYGLSNLATLQNAATRCANVTWASYLVIAS